MAVDVTSQGQGQPWYDIFLPFDPSAFGTAVAGAGGSVTNWLTGVGGDIASALETGAVALLGDLWNVISGPIYVLIGSIIIIITITWALKNQLIQLGQLIAMAAA